MAPGGPVSSCGYELVSAGVPVFSVASTSWRGSKRESRVSLFSFQTMASVAFSLSKMLALELVHIIQASQIATDNQNVPVFFS